MKVAIIVNSNAFGGGERYVVLLTRELHRRGVSVRIGVPPGSAIADGLRIAVPSASVFDVSLGPKLSDRTKWEFLAHWYGYRRGAAEQITTLVNDGIDLLHLQYKKEQLLFTRLAADAGIRVVWTEHGPLPPAFQKNVLARWLYGRASRGVHSIIAVAEHVRRSIEPFTRQAGEIRVVLNGVEQPFTFGDRVHRELRQKGRRLLGLGDHVPVVLYLSRLDRGKLPLLVPEIAVAIPPQHRPVMVMAGTGECEASVRQRASELEGSKVLVLGFQQDPRPLLAASDVLLSLSSEATEGLPLRCLEAMAAGLPVVASDVPAHREIVSHGRTGLLVKSTAPVDFAKAVAQALEPNFLASARQAAIRDTQSRFSLGGMIEGTLGAYECALQRSADKRREAQSRQSGYALPDTTESGD